MSRFNKTVTPKVTVNRAGGKSYRTSDKYQMVSILLNSFMKDKFYESGKDEAKRFKEIFDQMRDKKFAAKAAIYARNEFGMRSITHYFGALVAKTVKGQEWTKNFFEKVVRRPDDMTETLSAYFALVGKRPIPNALKKGFRAAFSKFDRYQLGKYQAKNKEVSLVDIVNLVRPVPTPRNKSALRELVKGTLTSTDTWEKGLTQAGQKGITKEQVSRNKAEVWKDLIERRQIGFFALLRNLRNIHQQASSDVWNQALRLLTDRNMIRKSLVLPFRFITAYQELNTINDVNLKRALSRALDISCENVPKMNGRTLVVADYSGSMGNTWDRPKGQATILGAIAAKANDADFMIFGNEAKYIPYNPDDSTITLINNFMALNRYHYGGRKDQFYVGHGTSFSSIFRAINQKYDRIFIFSDMQGWYRDSELVRAFNAYKKNNELNTILYSFDLAGYGTMMFPEKSVVTVAGYSEKVFDMVDFFEQDKDALIRKIDQITL